MSSNNLYNPIQLIRKCNLHSTSDLTLFLSFQLVSVFEDTFVTHASVSVWTQKDMGIRCSYYYKTSDLNPRSRRLDVSPYSGAPCLGLGRWLTKKNRLLAEAGGGWIHSPRLDFLMLDPTFAQPRLNEVFRKLDIWRAAFFFVRQFLFSNAFWLSNLCELYFLQTKSSSTEKMIQNWWFYQVQIFAYQVHFSNSKNDSELMVFKRNL